ncbi:DUF192 domain-containing protein [Natronorubrum sulfidifaciens]|uniref:DUF192 domain-containing protein n=1 Tax=Natronorubrum sulfidifaciens JCM 14089 TaxID=1230460 RepID=L9WIR0_9EURY|nr:hypothetical protein C495_02125 [Natronorubrum sulfidifaciens JCM 14089]
MRLVHHSTVGSETEGSTVTDRTATPNVVATDVDLADSLVRQTRGLMFRRSIPDDYALAFRFGSVKTRDVHMLFVFFPIDAVWIVDDIVQRVERLRPWRSFERERCDLLVELPAGAGSDIEPGDRLVLESA